MPNYALDFGPAASGVPQFTVFRDVTTGTDHLSAAPTLSGLTSGYVDFTWSSGIHIHFRAELGSQFIVGELDQIDRLPTGEGSIRVDHDYGGADNLQICDEDTLAPVDNAFVYIYRTVDFQANRTDKSIYLQAWTITNQNGRWITPAYLDPDEYTILVIKSRAKPKTRNITVP